MANGPDALARLKEVSDQLVELDPGIFQQIIDSLPIALLIVDETGRILLVNQQLELLFGYPRAMLLGKAFDMLIPEDHRQAHTGHFVSFMSSPTVRPMNPMNHFSGRRKDGSEVPLQISLGPIISTHGIWAMAVIRRRPDAI